MNTEQLNDALKMHKLWLDGNGGKRADLSGAYLSRADLSRADLSGANLSYANLSGADLSRADVPTIPHIDAQILGRISSVGCALEMGRWHTCETTHCRAGWAIVLAGQSGLDLEKSFGPSVAGALIYAKSRPSHPVPNFHSSNEDALEDIKKHAALDPLPA